MKIWDVQIFSFSLAHYKQRPDAKMRSRLQTPVSVSGRFGCQSQNPQVVSALQAILNISKMATSLADASSLFSGFGKGSGGNGTEYEKQKIPMARWPIAIQERVPAVLTGFPNCDLR